MSQGSGSGEEKGLEAEGVPEANPMVPGGWLCKEGEEEPGVILDGWVP